ncbi:MAG TPA: GNAT family N-acetyltransferase [Thermoanaerobaculia bacterium]|nr:GNAT family N-acetyltransferase [Thermoanaerobaculia bacterium]
MIDRLTPPATEAEIHELAEVLVDAVRSGASVSFLEPFTLDDAEQWWRRTLASANERAIFLVARDDEGIAGTVQVQPAWAPNQPHRGDVAKLLVHRRARGRGVGAALMRAAETGARDAGFTLLTLDTVRGDNAERLYERAGWTRVGVIPDYALFPDGSLCDTVVFYKKLS